MGRTLLRIFPLPALQAATVRTLCGSDRGRYWALSPSQAAQLKGWALAAAVMWPAVPKALGKPKKRKAAISVRPAPGYTARRARTHPVATRERLNDCDYLDKLSPAERAWKDQFDRETILNRWHDKDGVTPFYTGEERRKLQFAFNRTYDDIYNSKEWWAHGIDHEERQPGAHNRGVRDGATKLYSLLDLLPASAPTEDVLIDAIDRSRESE